MGVLQRFERRLGGLVEGAFAKVFKGGVEPVEIASALARETDDRRAISANRTLVPNEFAVELATGDYTRLAPYKSALCDELAAMVREHAAEQRYTFVGPVSIRLAEAPDLDVGVFRIRSSVAAADAGGFPNRGASGRSRRGGSSRPRLVITTKPAQGASGGEREYVLDSEVAVIGRSVECEIRLNDTGVSRRHAEIRRMPDGRHVFADLGSTNGSLVNGRPASQARLADGDRVEVGNTTIVYRNEDQRAPSRERRPPEDGAEEPRDPYGRGGYPEPERDPRGGGAPGGRYPYGEEPPPDAYGRPDPYRQPPPAHDPYADRDDPYRSDPGGFPERSGYGAPVPDEYADDYADDRTVGPRGGPDQRGADPRGGPDPRGADPRGQDPYADRGDPYGRGAPAPAPAPDPYRDSYQRGPERPGPGPDPYAEPDPYASHPGSRRAPQEPRRPEQAYPPQPQPPGGDSDPYWQQRDAGYGPPSDPYGGRGPGGGRGGPEVHDSVPPRGGPAAGPVYGDVREGRHRRPDLPDDDDPRDPRHDFPDRSW